MISDEEMREIVMDVADKNSGYPFDSNGDYVTLRMEELKSIYTKGYEAGRKAQRESDAELAQTICFDRPTIGDTIRNNTGELT